MDREKKLWNVEIHRVARKGIKQLPSGEVESVWEKINSLKQNPRPAGCRPLQGCEGTYRVRVGEYRIIYSIIKDKLIVLVLEVSPRGAAYKGKY